MRNHLIGKLLICVAMLAMAGCSGKMLDASGRVVGTRNGKLADIGAYRVYVSEVYVASQYEIPPTRHFSLGWSPEGVRKIHDARGYRPPTQTDWARYRAYMRQIVQKVGQGAKDADAIVATTRANAGQGDYEYVVWPDSRIGSCKEANGLNKWCGPPARLSPARMRALAAQALARVEPGCRLVPGGQAVVEALMYPGQKGDPRQGLWAEVNCRPA